MSAQIARHRSAGKLLVCCFLSRGLEWALLCSTCDHDSRQHQLFGSAGTLRSKQLDRVSPAIVTGAIVCCRQVEFAAVDCTVETAVCNANDVKGYPTMKYYNYFKTSKSYDGGRTVRGLGTQAGR